MTEIDNHLSIIISQHIFVNVSYLFPNIVLLILQYNSQSSKENLLNKISIDFYSKLEDSSSILCQYKI